MERICFVLEVRPDGVEEYRRRHNAVWEEMRAALTVCGWHNYSLFLRDDGLLIGYVECDDFEAIRAAMEATEVNARWQAEVGHLFVSLHGQRPDQAMTPLPEVFHLP